MFIFLDLSLVFAFVLNKIQDEKNQMKQSEKKKKIFSKLIDRSQVDLILNGDKLERFLNHHSRELFYPSLFVLK